MMINRTRSIKKSFWINEDEEKKLKDLSQRVGCTESDLFRSVINEKKIKEKPSEDFYSSIKFVRSLSNDISRLNYLLSKNEIKSEVDLKDLVEKVDKFILDIKKSYLL